MAQQRKKLTLECRTGAAVELARSGKFLSMVGSHYLFKSDYYKFITTAEELILYFGKQKDRNADLKH
ncbi:ANM_collapsed_G0016110.mRNA.1.CDS.1 [Saccharomyces cerevisiae]|nr:ANM_collapsed_G0016110.mRNA.1.CDS.1 [Saccharomyces cerevisiae]